MDIKNILFLNSHPIQYFAPLYKYMNNEAGIQCKALYSSTHGLSGEIDKQFGQAIKWDLPILEGYPMVFLKNYSFRPSIYQFWGLLNLGLPFLLFRFPKSIVVIHGWNYASNWIAIFFARLAGHIVCIRAETPLKQEVLKPKWKRRIRALLFKIVLKGIVDFYLPIGKQNKAFYQSYGIPTKQLIDVPYAVDNERFQSEADALKKDVKKIYSELGLDENSRIVLFVGKFIEKKRPFDLVKAFSAVEGRPNSTLIMVGSGELQAEMESYITENQIQEILFPGFVNQSQICKYYAVADVLVMCSEQGETWGLAVNEAMNFSLPIIISDMVGCSDDLVTPGLNGWIYKCGDIAGLKKSLEECLSREKEKLQEMGKTSRLMIDNYSFEVIANQLKKIGSNNSSK